MEYILGVDQGGTKTMAAIADREGNILSCGYGRGRVFDPAEGLQSSLDAIRETYRDAVTRAGISFDEINMLYAGLTGADWPHEYAELGNALHKMTGLRNIRLFNDCVIAMRSGTEKSFGAAVCAGTGLNVCIKSPEGKEFIYGYFIHDKYQGGTAIGERAVTAVIESSIGLEPPTALTEVLMCTFDTDSAEELLFKKVNGQLGDQSKYLVPAVLQKANEGDLVAGKIVREMAEKWAKYVVEGLKRFDMLQLETEIVFAGSVLKAKSETLREMMKAAILEAAPKARIVDSYYEPVVGAILLALDDLYREGIPETVKQNVKRTCGIHNLIRTV